MVFNVPLFKKRMVSQMIRIRFLSAVLSIFTLLALYTVAYCAESYDGEVYLSGETEDIAESYPDVVSMDFVKYHDGIVNNRDTGYLKVVEKDGRTTLETVPNLNAKDAPSTTIDGYHYTDKKIHVGVYKWAAVEYYYSSDAPLTNIRMRLSPMLTGGALLKTFSSDSQSYLSANTWDVALFNMSAFAVNSNPDAKNPHISQIHLNPFGVNNIKKHKGNDAMYIGKVMFFKEKPTLKGCRGYMKGYDDGTFRPSNLLSRAQACAVAARVIADEEDIFGVCTFKDVDEDAWYAKYIGFCQEKGLLDSFKNSSEFCPDIPVTTREFASVIISAKSLCDKDAASLPNRSEAFVSADDIVPIFGKTENPISRADAAKFVNTVFERGADAENAAGKYLVLYLDVKSDHYAYADIAEASIDHVEANGKWAYTLSDHSVDIENIVGTDYFYNTSAGYEKIAELDILETKRINEIRNTQNTITENKNGKIIYVSPDGSDKNDGLSEETPVKTFAHANTLSQKGDAVLLERGGMWREKIVAKQGVTYSAYGHGAKPILIGSPENGADASKWVLVYENKETGALIWRYDREDWLDVGGIVFNGGEGIAYKDLPDNVGDKYVVYGNRTTDYDYRVELDRNFEFVHLADSVVGKTYIDCNNSVGELYLRCDNGNPGKIFDSIEFITRGACIRCGTSPDITIDNIDFRYTNFGVSASTIKNLTVTNCEFYWIGGCVQTYEMRKGVATRYGNAIEIYGGCDGYLVDNCYFYEVYDAAVTHQVGNQDAVLHMDNIVYSNNVMDKCQYSIEYFFGGPSTDGAEFERTGTNVLFTGNLCRRAGYGFGSTRRDLNSQRHIRSGGSRNEFYDFRIENNIFDRSVYELCQTTCLMDKNKPSYDGNVYIQGLRNRLYSHGATDSAYMTITAEDEIKTELGDKNALVYFVDHIPSYEWSFTYDKTAVVTNSDRS